MGLFYKATIQAVLLHRAKIWTLMVPLLHMLQSFHNCCAYLTWIHNVQLADGTWKTSPATAAQAKAGLFTIEEYIQ